MIPNSNRNLYILLFTCAAVLLLLVASVVESFGQAVTKSHSVQLTIPVIAMLDIEPNVAPITLSLTPPNEAGQPLTVGSNATNNTKRLNYTSAIAQGGTNKKITAQITSGTVPPGVSLRVEAGVAAAGGAGTKGSPTGLVTLDATAKNLITGIGRCYTGDGSGFGHVLTYSVIISNYSLLKFNANNSVQITYTISA